MSLHKLWAGSGYEYLTRQVARQDATHAGRAPLASYYSERGETPGLWVGSGLAGVDGLTAGQVVEAEQMRSLFGQGLHPLAESRVATAAAAGASLSESAKAGHLGAPFRVRSTSDTAFEAEVSRRLAARRSSSGEPPTSPQTGRAAAVSKVAAEWFERQHGRAPSDARELSSAVARWSASPAQPVSGFDLTFSPVKSVSALWAVAPPAVAAEIERCHRAAVGDALRLVETRALFSREGARGVRQVEVTGLVGAAFTHRDSRAGDPDLHTHVAVANKVQTRQGKWLAIDGRVLYAATVAASETYNTAVERHLGERLGLRFASRLTGESGDRGRRPVREVVGVDGRLLEGWSSRRRDIDVRRAELARDFQQQTGRPPTRREAWALAQQATLETRPAKHEPRSLDEQRTAWAAQADQLLGGRAVVDSMVFRALAPRLEVGPPVDGAWIAQTAGQLVAVLEAERATWNVWHLQAEAQRQVRTLDVTPDMAGHVVDLVVGDAINRCVPLMGPPGLPVPVELQRSDGSSVYEVVGTHRWTSSRVLTAEDEIVAAGARHDGRRVDTATVELALSQAALEGPALNPGQVGLVRELAGSGRRVQLALAPAGTGKTTALRVLAQAWVSAGGNVVGLAPSAAAAGVLAEQLDGPTDTLAKLVWALDHLDAPRPAWVSELGPRSLVVVDEAGLADSPSLARAISYVLKVGGSVRLVGDDQQLAAVGAGGVLRDLAARHGAVRLDDVVRFSDAAEAAASLALREGRPEAIGFYLDEHRIHVGDTTTAADQLFAAWTTDRAEGRDSLMLAPTRDLAADLNARARATRLSTAPTSASDVREVVLADHNHASVGDTVITRTNDRRLRSGSRWVRNGDRWRVNHVHRDGRLTVRTMNGDRKVTLPAPYVTESVELGYASTIHAAQGSTCDTVHGLITGQETRAQLYTLLTRGRSANHVYLQLDPDAGTREPTGPDAAPSRTATQMLEQIVTRDGDDQSATGYREDLHDPTLRLPDEIDRYRDSLRLAAEHTTPPEVDLHLTTTAQRLVPGLTDEPAWPTLRSQLLLDATYGHDPAHQLTLAVAVALQLLDDPDRPAHDRAAVLHRRILSGQASPAGGPLPWLPPVPERLLEHPTFGAYLTARSTLVRDLAEAVRTNSAYVRPAWTNALPEDANPDVVGDIAVWRASHRIPTNDPSPLGAPPTDPSTQPWYHHLEVASGVAATDHAEPLLSPFARPGTDPYRPQLERHLASLTRQDVAVRPALQAALDEKPLPDDYPSAALWWRLQRHLSPEAIKALERRPANQSDNTTRIPEGPAPARMVTAQHRVDLALLVAGMLRLGQPAPVPERPSVELAPERRAELLKVNELTLHYYRSRYAGSWSARYLTERCGKDLADDARFSPGHAPAGWTHLIDHLRTRGVTDQDMLDAGVARHTSHGNLIDLFRDRLVLPIHDTDGDLVGFVARRHDRPGTPTEPKYLNTPTTALYSKSHHLYGAHLLGRGRAQRPVDDNELTRTGSAARVPVLVEGPLDAIAISLADGDRHTGVATLGTALTDQQAALIGHLRMDPILAPDPDTAGAAAAERAFWTLTHANLDPRFAQLPASADPAELYRRHGAASVRAVLANAGPLADHLRTSPGQAVREQIDWFLRIAAARPPRTWATSVDMLTHKHHLDPTWLREQLLHHVQNDSQPPTREGRVGERLDLLRPSPATRRPATTLDQRETHLEDVGNAGQPSGPVQGRTR
nr:MobF family relaxase [Microlunatus antarcticus]